MFLDPAVWAPSVRDARGEGRHNPHVVNPATNRLERLDLSNALLGNGLEGPRLYDNAPPRRVEEGPINVDLTGQARGACTACDRCRGYERNERLAENENDLEVLRCRHCGCQSYQHQAI